MEKLKGLVWNPSTDTVVLRYKINEIIDWINGEEEKVAEEEKVVLADLNAEFQEIIKQGIF